MTSLQVRGDLSVTKQKALEDAKRMQNAIAEQCTKSGKDVPEYQLNELIGKGSFGRVYKAKSLKTNQLVAVKIIDIEESDTVDAKHADTYSDLLKEINALQLLSNSGAKNVNHVIEALPVGQSMWMITEYCAGGSVATLMRPTAPGGLLEKWIIPILREVAEAIYWVHGQGIIHRDLKCANVLVTEIGNVQLCDFGVAGVIDTKFDKRTTFIGTLHWMAPELFDQGASYGTEVDIWAFGAMVHEIASGLPPNVTAGMDISRLGNQLKHQAPRLEGDRYSAGLKDIVAYCLEHDPKKRPTIEMVQRHRYIHQTSDAYPTSSLSHLVRAFKLWEAQGGDRRSLFAPGGAPAPSDASSAGWGSDEWNFSTTAAFDQQVLNTGDAQDVYDVYGSHVDFQGLDDTSRPQKPKSRRRPPPQLPSVKQPLEKLFDPNTISNYEDNSRAYYARAFPLPASDLPLRDDSMPSSDVRESLIDLDASLHGSNLSQFVDMNTIRVSDSVNSVQSVMSGTSPPLSDPADLNNHRRTQEWKFPVMAPPASANPEVSKFPFNDEMSMMEPSRPTLLHHQTEPAQPLATYNDLAVPKPPVIDTRASVSSLIDLDMSFADTATDYTRPSTSHSDVGSINGSEVGGANPFELEKHASLYWVPNTNREPSLYVSDESDFANGLSDLTINGDLRPEERQINQLNGQMNGQPAAPSYNETRPYSLSEFADMDPEFTPQQTPANNISRFPPLCRNILLSLARTPCQSLYTLPAAPSPHVLQGMSSNKDVKDELRRLAMSLSDHLSLTNSYISSLPIRQGNAARGDMIGEAVEV
ncbi:kinase-like domain-containing protein [Stachybotrys elegans]|uniref:non-specific serine/threonine protein kinase n=1 Tax=Stachybotrys elegans TaxID=80388 RepID=A0A8K0T7P2_9HYPO|nr:kinase-like domain-containing protein [Stachybotrys elegans]